MVEVGEPAPDATFTNEDGDEVEIATFEGDRNVVLAFFPFAFSSVCTNELKGFRDRYEDFQSLDTEVFGVSTDSHFSNDAFKEALDLPFSLLSDWDRTEAARFDALYKDRGHTKRAVTIIDDEGNVAWHREFEPSTCPDAGKILDQVKQIRG